LLRRYGALVARKSIPNSYKSAATQPPLNTPNGFSTSQGEGVI